MVRERGPFFVFAAGFQCVSDAGTGCVLYAMGTTSVAIAGWMEIPATPGMQSMGQFERAGADDSSAAAAAVAISALVDEYAGTLYRVAYSVLRNSADAEDAVQETYLRVLRHRDSLNEIRDPRVWLVRIVWNVVLDRKRRSKTRPETDDIADLARLLPASGQSAEDRVSSAQHHERVLRAVAKLPAKEQQVLILSAFEELSSVEIAHVLGTTESTIRSRLFRARKLLAGLLGQAQGTMGGAR